MNNLANWLAEAGRSDHFGLAREASAHHLDLIRSKPDVFRSAAEQADGLMAALVENQL